MAQLDNDQVETRDESKATESGAGRMAMPDERRRQHLLLLSSSSSSSSASSSALSDGGGGDDQLSFVEAHRAQFERGRPSQARLLLQQASHLDRHRRNGSNRRRQHAMSLQSQPKALSVELSLASVETETGTSRSNVQLSRQHSDGSAIGMQLMELKINDDLSSSASGALLLNKSNMLMAHAQQQQQAQEMDTRLQSSATATTSARSAYNQRQQMPANGQAPPLVLISPAEQHQEHYPAQNNQQQPYQGQYDHYTLADQLAPSPFHHQQPPDQLGRGLDLYSSSDNHYDQLIGEDAQLSYANLDEETTRHQQQRQRQDAPPAKNLPESVVRVNEQVAVDAQQRHHAFYPHQGHQQHHNPEQPIYAVMTRANQPIAHRANLDSSTTLTALNSVSAGELDQRQSGSLKQSGSAVPWRQSFTELGGPCVGVVQHNYTDQSRTDPEHSFNGSPSQQHLTGSFASNRSSHDDEDSGAHHHRRQTQRLSTEGLDSVQASHSSNDNEEELKVCEWRGCGNPFMDMNEFVRHLEEKHVNSEPHEKNRYFCLWQNCKRNKQEFNARYKLLIHMRVHSGEKPYSCTSVSCKKSFSRLENLKIHVRSHTGEKPYKCNYEHCSKSFTNSSDRIKHHKTHKDPKPYNCTYEGCTKRYTDPSSLRKHLRAHKRDGFGSMDSSESPAGMRYSAGTSSHSSQMDQTFVQAPLTTSGHHNHHHQQQQPPQQHHQHQQHVQYPYAETVQAQQQVGASYEQHQEQHQQELTYLNADYDPSREFANVLSSNATDMDSSLREEATADDEANYYANSSFDGRLQRQEESHLTNLDEINARTYVGQSQHRADQYTATVTNRQYQRPAARFRNQMELQEFHQQLAKSWGGGSSSSDMGMLQSNLRTGQPNISPFQRQAQQPRMVSQQESLVGPPWRAQRRVEFEFAPPRRGHQDESSQQAHDMHHASCTDHAPNRVPESRQQHSGQNWQARGAQITNFPADNNQQRQIHYQQQQQQQQQQHQHQSQLTRRQQHEQLMRSTPARVSFFES